MEFGIPSEIRPNEYRVSLAPAGVDTLLKAGHIVYFQHNAGASAGFDDEEYRTVGARVVYSPEEVWRRAEVVVKVARPTAMEHVYFQGQTLLAFMHLAVASPDLLAALREQNVTAVAYEMIQAEDGTFPVLHPTSEVAGRLAPIIAGSLLESMTCSGPDSLPKGRGTLLSGIPGVPSASVVILGAGVVGSNAARAFVGLGAQVTVLDNDIRRLQHLDDLLNGRVVTMTATPYNIEKVVAFADVLIGAVYVTGHRAPVVVSRDMVRSMRPRAVIIDFAIDQGGCVETSRPTTHRDPVFFDEGIIHYCVPNVPARVARTGSYALTNAVLPYLQDIGKFGIDGALQARQALRLGLNVYRGTLPELEVRR